MSLILDEQFLSGFVTQSELDAYTGRLAAARERLHTPDGQPKGWRTLPCDTGEELLSAVETAARAIREEADILLVIGMCVGPNQSSFTQNGLTVVVVTMLAVLLHHVLGLVAGYAIARVFRFNEAKTRALSLEVGLQNSGLSCTLAASAFPGTLAVLPCVLATVVHQVVGPVVANLFAARDTKPAKAPAGSAEAAEA